MLARSFVPTASRRHTVCHPRLSGVDGLSSKVGRGGEVLVHVQRRRTQSNQQLSGHSILQGPQIEQHTASASAAQQLDPSHDDFWPPGYAPGTLTYALSQVQLLAAPGSSWPFEQQAAFTKAADLTGGFWLLTQCGEWGEDHSLAGKPARVLTQLVFCLVGEPTLEAVDAAKKPWQRPPPSFSLVQQPVPEVPPDKHQVSMLLAYELDAHGWPTGAVLGSATGMVLASTRVKMQKPSLSFNVVQNGSPFTSHRPPLKPQGCTLGNWSKQVLDRLPAVVLSTDRRYRWHLHTQPPAHTWGDGAEQSRLR